MSERDTFNRHLLHPWAYLPALGDDDSTPVIVRGEGVYIYDEDGNRLLDGPGGMWCMQTGYGRREIADAVSEQIMQLGYSTGFFVINPVETELAQRIAAKTPGDLNRVFFTTGGSTAVDSALRLCQLANNIKGMRGRKHILTREHAYHGSTFLAASVTGKERDKTAMDTWQECVHFLSSPCAYYHDPDFSEQALCDYLVQELENKILELGPENVMCFIAEPVLASGGVIVPPLLRTGAGARHCLYSRRGRHCLRSLGALVCLGGSVWHDPGHYYICQGHYLRLRTAGRIRGLRAVHGLYLRRAIGRQQLLQRLYLVSQPGVLRSGTGELGHHRARGAAGPC